MVSAIFNSVDPIIFVLMMSFMFRLDRLVTLDLHISILVVSFDE